MSAEAVVAACAAAGLPCVNMVWPIGSAPDLPWCVWRLDYTDGFDADDTVYARASRVVVELYERSMDASLEAALEASIAAAFGPFSKSQSWAADEGCLVTYYGFTDIENGV